jgi:hypothetical protein
MPRQRLPFLLFVCFLGVIAGLSVVRVWALAPLYSDASIRRGAMEALRNVEEKRGWILSDIDIRSADPSSLTVVHREHRRNSSSPQCFVLQLSSSGSLVSCEK